MTLFENRGASPMLIAKQTDAFDSAEWLYELKLDGFRCLAYADRGMVDFRNKRNMQMLPKFPELKEIFRNVKGRCILDGEIVVLSNGVPDFYRLQKRTMLTDRFKIEMEASRYPASFVAFDCIAQGEQILCEMPLIERKARLAQLVSENKSIACSRFVEREGIALYRAADAGKLEGVVAKRRDSLYFMGKRTKDWVKFKRMADEDFIAAGYIKKAPYTYSLVLAKFRQGQLIYKGHVTSGVTKDMIDGLEVSGKMPFAACPAGNEEAIWLKIKYVCVVQYMPNERNVLRQPVFKGLRDDVQPEDVQEEI